MTREEAIKYAKSKKMMLELLIYNDDCKYGNYAMYSTELSFVNVVLSALRPVSREQELEAENMELKERIVNWRKYMAPTREQVEKVWKGEWLHDPETGYECCKECRHTICLNDYLNGNPPPFCEFCGAPMTDEAVEMVMERLEALHETV